MPAAVPGGLKARAEVAQCFKKKPALAGICSVPALCIGFYPPADDVVLGQIVTELRDAKGLSQINSQVRIFETPTKTLALAPASSYEAAVTRYSGVHSCLEGCPCSWRGRCDKARIACEEGAGVRGLPSLGSQPRDNKICRKVAFPKSKCPQ